MAGDDDKKVDDKSQDDKKNVNWEQIAKERIASLDKQRTKNQELETRLAAIEAERATAAEKARVEQEEKDRSLLVEKGKFQEALKLEQDKFSRERNDIVSSVHKAVIPATIKVALTKIPNLVPTAIDDVTEQLQNKIGIDPKTLLPFVKDSTGSPLKGADGLLVAPEAFITDFVDKRSYLKLDGMATGSGVNAGNKGNTDTSGMSFTAENALSSRKVADAWQEKDPEGYKAAMDAHFKSQRKALRK